MHTGASLAGILCVVAACGTSSSPPTAVESVLDSLVPGPRLGARAAPVAAALHLPFAPHQGYADTAFHSAAGVHGLILWVDEVLASGTDRPTRWARIARIGIGFSTQAGADSARQLATRHLGRPFCFLTGTPDRPLETYFWPDRGPQGVLLEVPLRWYEPPFMVFGIQGPDPSRAARRPCEAP